LSRGLKQPDGLLPSGKDEIVVIFPDDPRTVRRDQEILEVGALAEKSDQSAPGDIEDWPGRWLVVRWNKENTVTRCRDNPSSKLVSTTIEHLS
jgi:hypothetical protein